MVSSDATASSWQSSVPATRQPAHRQSPAHRDERQGSPRLPRQLRVGRWTRRTSTRATRASSSRRPAVLTSADNWVAVKYGGMPPTTAYAVTLADAVDAELALGGRHAGGEQHRAPGAQHPIPPVSEAPLWGTGGVTVNGNGIEAGEVKAMFQNGHIYWAKTTTCGSATCERLSTSTRRRIRLRRTTFPEQQPVMVRRAGG